jgi:hypothetical protein
MDTDWHGACSFRQREEEQNMKKKLLAIFLIAGASAFAKTHFSVGFSVGPAYAPRHYYVAPAPPPPSPVAYYAPAPGPGYVWINGYYYPSGARYVWRPGYWVRPPHPHAVWVAPRYHHGHFYAGYWR